MLIRLRFQKNSTETPYIILLTALFALLIFGFRYLPIMDYPDFLYQGVAAYWYVAEGNSLNGFLQPFSYIAPNTASTVLIGLFSTILPPELAGKVFLFLMTTGTAIGALRFMAWHSDDESLLPIMTAVAVLVTLSATLWNGFVNYNFSLAIALYSYPWIASALPDKPRWQRIMPALLLCYVSHFIGFLILGAFLTAEALATKNKRLFTEILLSAVPSVLLLLWYIVAKDIPAERPIEMPLFAALADRIMVTLGALMPFQRIRFVSEPAFWMKGLNYALLLFVISSLLLVGWHSLRERQFSMASIIILLFSGIAVATPTRFHGFEHIGGRLIVPIFLCIIIFYTQYISEHSKLKTALTGLTAGIALLSVGYYSLQTAQFNAMVTECLPPPTSLEELHNTKNSGSEPFLRLPYYKAIENRLPMPFLSHALFSYQGANPTDPSPAWFLDSLQKANGRWWEHCGEAYKTFQ